MQRKGLNTNTVKSKRKKGLVQESERVLAVLRWCSISLERLTTKQFKSNVSGPMKTTPTP